MALGHRNAHVPNGHVTFMRRSRPINQGMKMNSAINKGLSSEHSNRMIPTVGTKIKVVGSLMPIKHEGSQTPVCKVKYNADDDTWSMVPLSSSGLIIFLNDVPDGTETHLIISQIAKTGKGCYADLAKCSVDVCNTRLS